MLHMFANGLVGSCFFSAIPLSGCQSTSPRPDDLFRTRYGHIDLVISYPPTLDIKQWKWVENVLPFVDARLKAFAIHLKRRILVQIHPSVKEFVNATGQTKAWLRAWSTYATIHVLTPDHWGNRSLRAQQERLTHELSHCGIYQFFPSLDLCVILRFFLK